MNVYDFDKTIFDGDTEDRFFAFLFEKHGWVLDKWIYHIFEFMYKHNLCDKTPCRETQYRVLRKIDNLDELLEEYWDSHEKYLMNWYINGAKDPSDVIATGSPRFLMEPIARRLGVAGLVATEMDPKTGKITEGKFAIQQYKLENYLKQYKVEDMDNFYSDAFTDHYMAEQAKHAYAIHDGEQMTEWNVYFAKEIAKDKAKKAKKKK